MTMLSDLIKKRQSARHYLSKAVPREDILECLKAAQLAPSACNSQPWHFVIVDDPALKTKLGQEIFSGPYAMNAFAQQAPVVVAVVSERSSMMPTLGGYFRGTPFNLIDIGIAVEHFILQATELGLSSCWIGWFDEAKAKKILNVDKNKKIDCVISLGYSEEPFREKTRKPMKEISSFNSYKS